MERDIDRRIVATSAVMQTLKWPVVVKRELSQKVKLSFTSQPISPLSPMVMSFG